MYSNQTWYQDVPLHHHSVDQISDNPFPLYDNFHTSIKRRKNEETKPIFETLYLKNAWRDLVEIWNVGY